MVLERDGVRYTVTDDAHIDALVQSGFVEVEEQIEESVPKASTTKKKTRKSTKE